MSQFDRFDNRSFKPSNNSPDLPELPKFSPNLSQSQSYQSINSGRRPYIGGGGIGNGLPMKPRNVGNGSQLPHLPTNGSNSERQWNSQQDSNVGKLNERDGVRNNLGNSNSTKKVNPLTDLIRTEGLYVDDLSIIIKRVAAAWSRANFPPPELDVAFRAVEAVYRVNKGLLKKLNEIGPTPSSPKALGDLLMSWVPTIQESYNHYAETFLCDFDSFIPVQSNDKLHTILAQLEYPCTLIDNGDRVTLDILFNLPFERISYYKKLFTRLLKSTQNGKSDFDLLVEANYILDSLIEKSQIAMRKSVRVKEEQVISFSSNNGIDTRESFESKVPSASSSSERFSSVSSAATSTALYSGPPRIEDLERRLSTERALDIFTMLPKKCKLQMAAPNLPFTRTLRQASDVKLSFFPLSDPNQKELIINRAFVFLLTDLFLICSKMTTEERNLMKGLDGQGPDMWLLYPPLAGKHLKIANGREVGELQVTVMKKEKLIIKTESFDAAASWKAAFEDTIAFGLAQGIRIKTDQLTTTQGFNSAGGFSFAHSGDSKTPILSNDKTPMPNNYETNRDGFKRVDSQRQFEDGSNSNRFADRPLPLRKQYNEVNSNSFGSVPKSPLNNGFGSNSPSFHVSQASEQYNNQFDSNNNYSSPSTGGSSNGPFTPTMNNNYQPIPPPIPNEKSNSFISNSSSFKRISPSDFDPLPIPNNRDYNRQSDDERNLSPASMGRRLDMSRSTSVTTDYEDFGKSPKLNNSFTGSGGNRIHSGASSQISNSNPSSNYGDNHRITKAFNDYTREDSPPPSPLEKDKTSIIAQMRCKIFLQQHHASWKSLGTAKLKLYLSFPSNKKQLVVESDKNEKKVFISTIILTDGVEKVGKTGIAIELSDKGSRTGIIYMLQMKTEQSALGLFDQLLLDSDRGAAKRSGR